MSLRSLDFSVGTQELAVIVVRGQESVLPALGVARPHMLTSPQSEFPWQEVPPATVCLPRHLQPRNTRPRWGQSLGLVSLRGWEKLCQGSLGGVGILRFLVATS